MPAKLALFFTNYSNLIMKKILLLCFLSLSIWQISSAQQAQLFTNGQAANLVIGQPDLNSNTADNGGISATSIDGPSGIAIDLDNGKMYVADEDNHRVLRYAYPFTSNQPTAEAVFGQPDFTSVNFATSQSGMRSPRALAIDNAGRLWVAETSNNRVLRFDDAANKPNGANADGVLGQPDFTSKNPITSQSGMRSPSDLTIDDAGRLWVVSLSNHRVLRFDNAANKQNGANADGVLGQPDFTSKNPITSQSGMDSPVSVITQPDGTLFVTNFGNHRVLRFDNAANKQNGANADGVLGQPDFTSKNSNTSQSGTSLPLDLSLDTQGNLYVTSFNNRVIIFNQAATKDNGANADIVLGQPDFTSSNSGVSATTMKGGFISSVFFDTANKVLWVADSGNNRVIRFGEPAPPSCSITNIMASTPTCDGDNVTTNVSFTATGGTGTIQVFNGATMVGSGTASPIAVTIDGPTAAADITLTVGYVTETVSMNIDPDDTAGSDCSGTVDITLPTCPATPTCSITNISATTPICNGDDVTTSVSFTATDGTATTAGFGPSTIEVLDGTTVVGSGTTSPIAVTITGPTTAGAKTLTVKFATGMYQSGSDCSGTVEVTLPTCPVPVATAAASINLGALESAIVPNIVNGGTIANQLIADLNLTSGPYTFTSSPAAGAAITGPVTVTVRDASGAIVGTATVNFSFTVITIPTMSEWGLLIFGLLMLNLGLVVMMRGGLLTKPNFE